MENKEKIAKAYCVLYKHLILLTRINKVGLSGIIEGFRAAIFGHPLNWQGLAVSAAIAASLFMTGAYTFRRLERQFADVI